MYGCPGFRKIPWFSEIRRELKCKEPKDNLGSFFEPNFYYNSDFKTARFFQSLSFEGILFPYQSITSKMAKPSKIKNIAYQVVASLRLGKYLW